MRRDRGAGMTALSAATDAMVEAVARRAAEIVLEELRDSKPVDAPLSPYMTVEEAATYLRCKRQRVDDLLSQRRLTRIRDGSRVLIERADVDAYLAAGGPLLTRAPRSRSGSRS